MRKQVTSPPQSRFRVCQVSVNWDGEPPWCGKLAGAVCLISCEHGHATEQDVCADDMAQLQQAQWVCGPCEEGPGPHECVLAPTFTPLGGSGG